MDELFEEGPAAGAVEGDAGAGAGCVSAGTDGMLAGACSDMQVAPRRVVPAGQLVGATIAGVLGAVAVAGFLRVWARRRFWSGLSCL